MVLDADHGVDATGKQARHIGRIGHQVQRVGMAHGWVGVRVDMSTLHTLCPPSGV